MISEQCQVDLTKVLTHIRKVANNMLSVRYASKRNKNYGVSAMLRNETMERWEHTAKISDFLTCEGAVVNREAIPASTFINGSLQEMNECVAMDKATVDLLTTLITSAMERKAYVTAQFMTDLRSCAQKEYNEIQGIVNEITATSADQGAAIAYDKWLLDEYEHKYDDVDFC